MGTYRKEWDCCGSVSETEAYEPEHCPFCSPTVNADRLRQIIVLLDKTITQKQQYADALRDDRLFSSGETMINSIVVQYLDANLDELRKIAVDLKSCLHA